MSETVDRRLVQVRKERDGHRKAHERKEKALRQIAGYIRRKKNQAPYKSKEKEIYQDLLEKVKEIWK